MKRSQVLAAGLCGLLVAAVAPAQQTPPLPRSGLPPPGINDPGVQPSPVPLPSNKIPPSTAPAVRDANGEAAPTVAVRKEDNGDVVQEYRRGGQLYMVKIIPVHGVTQTYIDNNGDGRLDRDPRKGPVDPVYYTIYQWGGPKKSAEQNSADGQN